MALFIGLLYACGVYLLLRRSLVKLILGVFVMSNATNLIIFLSGGITQSGIGFIPEGAETATLEGMTDPLPQAMILTSIVIGLGIAAYILVLKYKYYKITGSNDLDQMKNTDGK